jgi:hypothetical protein
MLSDFHFLTSGVSFLCHFVVFRGDEEEGLGITAELVRRKRQRKRRSSLTFSAFWPVCQVTVYTISLRAPCHGAGSF